MVGATTTSRGGEWVSCHRLDEEQTRAKGAESNNRGPISQGIAALSRAGCGRGGGDERETEELDCLEGWG